MAKTIIRDGELVTLVEEQLTLSHRLNLGRSLVQDISQESVNKIDKKEWLYEGVSEKNVEWLNNVSKNSRLGRIKKQIGHYLSQVGERAIMATVIDGEVLFDHCEVVYLDKDLKKYNEIILVSNKWQEKTKDHVLVPSAYRFFRNKSGKVIKEIGYQEEGKFVKKTKITYPKTLKRFPVQILRNNERGLSDIGNVLMWDAIIELDYHGSQLGVEWESTKTIWANNMNFNDGSEFDEFLASGKRSLDLADSNSAMQMPSQVISSGSTAFASVMGNITFISDLVRKYTHSQAETVSTGTNKHNQEVMTMNQKATEYLENKKEARELDYSEFIERVLELGRALKQISVSDEELNEVKVKLQISEIEQSILDLAEMSADKNKQFQDTTVTEEE